MLFKEHQRLVRCSYMFLPMLLYVYYYGLYEDLNINVTEPCPFGNLVFFNNQASLSHGDYCQCVKTIYRRIQLVACTTARRLF